MDISSVRIGPVPVKAQAVMTSTYGHPRLNWPAMAKVNNENKQNTQTMTKFNKKHTDTTVGSN